MIERHVALASEYVDTQARSGVTFDGSPLCCHATTRKGTSCQRVPLPASKYCPSHKHLEEELTTHGGVKSLHLGSASPGRRPWVQGQDVRERETEGGPRAAFGRS